LTGERLRGAAFAADGLSLVAIGAYGMYRFANGVWSALRAPRGIDGRSLRAIARVASGDLIVCGDGAASIVHLDGNATQIEIADADAVWLGALADARGIVLTGERRSRPSGIVAIVAAGADGKAKVMDIEGTARLHAATRLGNGTILVCGTHGALFALDGDDAQEVVWGRTGHLYAAATSLDGGAFVVGSGGHALAVAPPHPSLRGVAPEATLEAVQTTRDITAVTVDVEGTAWAAGAQGRLLARQAGTWSRVPADTGSAALVAVTTRSGEGRVHEVVALAEDGTVVEIALT
jgi:hypothetical protein